MKIIFTILNVQIVILYSTETGIADPRDFFPQ